MQLILKVFWKFCRAILFLATIIGIILLPADILSLPETYPLLKKAKEIDRFTLLAIFCFCLIAYIFWIDFKPSFKNWKDRRSKRIKTTVALLMIEHRIGSQTPQTVPKLNIDHTLFNSGDGTFYVQFEKPIDAVNMSIRSSDNREIEIINLNKLNATFKFSGDTPLKTILEDQLILIFEGEVT